MSFPNCVFPADSALDPGVASSPLDDDTEEVGVDGVTGDMVELADPGADSLFTGNNKLINKYQAWYLEEKMKTISGESTECALLKHQ